MITRRKKVVGRGRIYAPVEVTDRSLQLAQKPSRAYPEMVHPQGPGKQRNRRKPPDDFLSPIGRTVIDQHDLFIDIHRLYAFTDIRYGFPFVVNGNYDRQFHDDATLLTFKRIKPLKERLPGRATPDSSKLLEVFYGPFQALPKVNHRMPTEFFPCQGYIRLPLPWVILGKRLERYPRC